MRIHSTAGHKPGTENVLHKIPVLATKPAFGTGKRGGYKQAGEGKEKLPAQDWQYWHPNCIKPSQPNPQFGRRPSQVPQSLKVLTLLHGSHQPRRSLTFRQREDIHVLGRAKHKLCATRRGSLKCSWLQTQAVICTREGQNQDTKYWIGKGLCIPVHIRPVTISFLYLIYIFA